MALSAKVIRSQLHMLKPLVSGLSLESVRKGQDHIGQIMSFVHRKDVVVKRHDFADFEGKNGAEEGT